MPRLPEAELNAGWSLLDVFEEEHGPEDAAVSRSREEKNARSERRRQRRKNGLLDDSVPWVQMNSVVAQHILLYSIMALEGSLISIGLSLARWKPVALGMLVVIHRLEFMMYSYLQLKERSPFAEEMLGKGKYWVARHTVYFVALIGNARFDLPMFILLAAIYGMLAALTVALTVPWPIEAYELNAAKVEQIRADRQHSYSAVGQLAFLDIGDILLGVFYVLVQPSSPFYNAVLLGSIGYTLSNTQRLAVLYDLNPILQVTQNYGEGWMIFRTLSGIVVRFIFDLNIFRACRSYSYVQGTRTEWIVVNALQLWTVLYMFLGFCAAIVLVAYTSIVHHEQVKQFMKMVDQISDYFREMLGIPATLDELGPPAGMRNSRRRSQEQTSS